MAGLLAIDPGGVHGLARVLDQLADDAFLLAAKARRAASPAQLDLDAPGRLDHLGGAARAAAAVLRRRADLAAGFVLSLSGAFAALRSSSGAAGVRGARVAGGSAPTGAAPAVPAEPGAVVRVDLVTVAGELSLPGKGFGPSAAAAHAYRIEHLRSGRLRVTRLDRVAVGVGAGAANEVTVDALGVDVATGTKAEVALRLLAATGDTFEIDADELDELIAADLLDRANTMPIVQGVSPRGVLGIGRAVTGLADRVGWGPFDGLVHRAHELISARLPPPVSRFVEGGVQGQGSLAVASKVLFGLSLAATSYTIVGIERRDRERRDVVYLEAGSDVQAALQQALFGRTGADAEGDARVGVVRDRETGALVEIELTFSQRVDDRAERRIVRVDLADPAARRVLGELRGALPDPSRLAAAVATLVALPSTRIDHTRLRRTRDDVGSVSIAGNELRLVRQSFTVVDR